MKPCATSRLVAVVRISMKFASAAIGCTHHVERCEAKPCPVDRQTDIAVHPQVVEPAILRDKLDFIAVMLFAQGHQLGMPEQRVVVDNHLDVDRNELALVCHHQRVELDERCIEFDEGEAQLIDKRSKGGVKAGTKAKTLGQASHGRFLQCISGTERKPLQTGFARLEPLLDILASFSTGKDGNFGPCGINEQR